MKKKKKKNHEWELVEWSGIEYRKYRCKDCGHEHGGYKW